MPVSQVAQLREQIAHEYMAAKWGLSGLAYGISLHTFITARMERIGESHQALASLVGEQASQIVSDTLADIPKNPTRLLLLNWLQHELTDSEERAHLLDWIQDMWAAQDILLQRFGATTAHKIINASGEHK